MTLQIYCGVEIELEFNAEIMEFDIEDYHSGTIGSFSEHFKAENDGSLGTSKFDCGDTAEIISCKFKIEEYKKILSEFKRTVQKISSREELDEAICFNNTTGAHIHISMKDGRTDVPLWVINPKSLYGKVNKRMIKELKEAGFEKIVLNFYRDYANKLDKRSMRNARETKYMGWNYFIEDESDGLVSKNRLEFRSFNLRGITDWHSFFKAYEIAFRVIKEEIELAYRRRFRNINRIEIKGKEIKKWTIGESEEYENIQEIDFGKVEKREEESEYIALRSDNEEWDNRDILQEFEIRGE